MEFVRLDHDEAVAIVTIDRPKALNALSTQVLSELKEVFSSIDTDVTRVIILTGAGDRSFVAGADIDVMSNMSVSEAAEFSQLGNDIFRLIETLRVPVIAAVNGFALGGGMELAMACDFRIASENALFGQPEVGLGITPGFGGTQRLARTIGVGLAKEIIYTANNIKVDEAYRLGLVNHVYPLEDLMAQALKLAKKIARNAPIAVANSKKAINDGLQVNLDDGLALEVQLFSDCFESEDQKEGMSAFLEKRKGVVFNNR